MMRIVVCCGCALAGLTLLAPSGAEAKGPHSVSRPAVELSDVVLVQNKAGPFDGRWTINAASQTCALKSHTNVLTVVNGAIVSGDPLPAKGSVSANGAVRWTNAAPIGGRPVDSNGTFRGNTGSGTYQMRDGKCGGRFTATRS